MRIIHIITYHHDLICGHLHNCLKERILQENEEIIEMCFPLIPNIIIFIFQLINSIIHYFIQQTITMSVIISTSSLNS